MDTTSDIETVLKISDLTYDSIINQIDERRARDKENLNSKGSQILEVIECIEQVKEEECNIDPLKLEDDAAPEKNTVNVPEETSMSNKRQKNSCSSSKQRKTVGSEKISISTNGTSKTIENGCSSDDCSEVTITIIENEFQLLVTKWKSLCKFNSDDEKIQNKLLKHFNRTDVSFKLSKSFQKCLINMRDQMVKGNIYELLKDLRDTMKHYQIVEPQNIENSVVNGDPSSIVNFKSPKQRKLFRIEQKMKSVSRRIKELESEEVDFDEDENSSYILWDRLKTQFVKLDKLYCEIANCSKKVGRPMEKKFKYEGSRYPEINEMISKWVNKKKQFPDFSDIVRLVEKSSKESNLLLTPSIIHSQASEIFKDVGEMLKARRLQDDLDSIYAYGADCETDPANEDESLAEKLKSNEKVSKENFQTVFQHFVDKQLQMPDIESSEGLQNEECSDGSQNTDCSDVEFHLEDNDLTASEEENDDDLCLIESTSSFDLPVTNGGESMHTDNDIKDINEIEEEIHLIEDIVKKENKKSCNSKRPLDTALQPSSKKPRSVSPELVCLD